MKRSRLDVHGLALLTLGLACSRRTEEQFVYDPYMGNAYPNKRPMLPTIAGEMGLVTNSGSDTISVIDVAKGEVVATVPVGISPVDIDGPHHIALDRKNGVAYVALSYPVNVAAVGPHASHGASKRPGFVQKLSLGDLSPLGESRVDPNPGDIVASDDGQRIVVTHYDLTRAAQTSARPEDRWATLYLFSPDKITPAGGVDPVQIAICAAPHGVALSRGDGRYAFVACYGEDTMAIVDLQTPNAPIVRVPVGTGAAVPPAPPKFGPYAAVLSPDGMRIAIGNTESKDVRFLDTTTRTMTSLALATRGAAFFPAWSKDGTKIYAPSQTPDALQVYDATTGSELTSREFSVDECQRPHEAVFGADVAHVYLVCEGDRVTSSHILKLDATTLATVSVINVGVYPDRFAIGATP